MNIDTFKIWYRFNDDDTDDIREANAAMLPHDASCDALDAALNRDDIFYAFTQGERVLGKHGDFTIMYREVC